MNKADPDQETVILDTLAKEKAIELARTNPDWHGLPLRLYIEGKGCDGFYYGVTFDAPQSTDLQFPQGSQEDPVVITDTDTYPFVKGSRITWVDDERGKGFLVENPHHRTFRGKFFKRQVWRDKLVQKSSPD